MVVSTCEVLTVFEKRAQVLAKLFVTTKVYLDRSLWTRSEFLGSYCRVDQVWLLVHLVVFFGF